MPTFTFRPLSGFYKGSFANQLSDYTKINNSFLELSKDIPSLDARLGVLEANGVGIFSTGNFTTNSIQGSILADGSVPGNKITNNSITGDQIVLNSVHGLTDANISSAANISASKINLGEISHTNIKDIGTNTHPQIDTALSQLFHDVGSTVGSPLSQSLDSRVTANAAQVVSLEASLSSLNTFVNPQALGTTAQQVSNAINELVQDLQEIGASGIGIAGPAVSTLNAVTLWDSTNGRILKNSGIIYDSGSLTTTLPGNIELFNTGSNLATSAIPFQSINAETLRLQTGVAGGFIYGSGVGLTLQPGDAYTSTSFVSNNGTDVINLSGLVMDANHSIYTNGLNSRPGHDMTILGSQQVFLNSPTQVNIGGGGAVFIQGTGVDAITANGTGLYIDNTDAIALKNPQDNGFHLIGADSGVLIITSGTPITLDTTGSDNLGAGGALLLRTKQADITFQIIPSTGGFFQYLNLSSGGGVDLESFFDSNLILQSNGPGTNNVVRLTAQSGGQLQVGQNNISLTGGSTTINLDNSAGAGTGDLVIGTSGKASLTTLSDFDINSAVIQRTQGISDLSGGGDIGSAATTVDIDSSFNINQTTAAQTLTLPTPTITTAGRLAYVNNIGSTSFTMLGKVLPTGAGLIAMWNGSAWSLIGFGG